MKFLNFRSGETFRLGIKTEQGILDVEAAGERFGGINLPASVHQIIESGPPSVALMAELTEKALSSPGDKSSYLLNEESLQFGPCVTNPGKIICVGLNYRKHAEETDAAIPQYPILFNKFNNTLMGHGEDVTLPKVSSKVDYEAELVIVIGKKAKYIGKEQALHYVFGYCSVNDISARDLQMRTNQWLLGKSCDGFSPLGPYLVTVDEVGDANHLGIKCLVNGELRQNSNTSDMIFHCDEIVSYISQHMTLSPGDIILTGTPEGVVLGYPPEKQNYLKNGDVVTVEIEKLGTLTNRMAAEI